MSFFTDNAYPQDFNLGGFQQSGGPMGTEHGYGTSITGDPRVTTQPQPYQQGPGGTTPIESLPQFKNVDWSKIGWGHSPDVIEPPLGGYPNTNQPLPDWMQKDPSKVPMAGGWLSGRTSGSIGNGGGTQGPMRMWDVFSGARNPVAMQNVARQGGGTSIQDLMAQNGGFYAPPAMNMGPNGPQQTPGAPQQPVNPSQQNQTLMQSPDGQHFQYVNQEHVPHYQGLGATIHNGSSYGV